MTDGETDQWAGDASSRGTERQPREYPNRLRGTEPTETATASRRTVLKAGALAAFAAFLGSRALPNGAQGDDGTDRNDGGGQNGGDGLAPVGESDQMPTDPDDDGLYEDVDGDGELDTDDSGLLFENLDGVDPEYFDFNGNGRMDIADVRELREEVTDGSG